MTSQKDMFCWIPVAGKITLFGNILKQKFSTIKLSCSPKTQHNIFNDTFMCKLRFRICPGFQVSRQSKSSQHELQVKPSNHDLASKDEEDEMWARKQNVVDSELQKEDIEVLISVCQYSNKF